MVLTKSFNHIIGHVIGFVLLLLITACSSNIPVEIRQGLEGAPSLAEVRNQPEDFTSQRVRWGGVILDTENKHKTSRLTIIAFPLDDNGKPRVSGQSSGRFIAIVNDFLEPLVYSRERLITVTGELTKTETHKVGEFPYLYPVTEVDFYHLWPQVADPATVDYPLYRHYNPWFYPYSFPRYYPRRLVPNRH